MSHKLNLHDGTGIIAEDPGLGILLSYGSSVPSGVGYAPGAHFLKTNGTGLASTTYVNIGTKAAANFVTAGPQSTSPSLGIGYATGAGIAVTQGTSTTTTVVGNGVCGTITTFAQTAAAGVDVSFTFTNSAIAANDVVVVSTKSYGGTADGIPIAAVQATAAGSCIINIRNTGAVALDALCVLNFAVIKAVAA